MITKIVLWLVATGLIVYDVIAGPINEPTESSVLRTWAMDWTFLPFIFGFLIGHWFGPRQHVDVSGWMWALPIVSVLVGIDIFMKLKYPGVYVAWRYPLFYVLTGIPCGMYIWGQSASGSIIP